MADIQVAKGPAVFSCIGLGSCIGLVAHDKLADVTGMVHIMLPEAFKDKPVDKPGKFADTGIAELLRQMAGMGAEARRTVVAFAGGAQVFKYGSGGSDRLDVGARNGQAVEAIIKNVGLRLLASDVGGSNGRTVTVDAATGIVKIRTLVTGERILCNLKYQSLAVAA
jgi:chemotaxis protein CheD